MTNESDSVINFDDDKISVSEYTRTNLNVYNDSNAIYEIESYFVLYSSKTTSEYSKGVCDIYDATYFIPKQHYTFENIIQVEYNDQVAQKAHHVTLTANSPPTSGECSFKTANISQATLFAETQLFCDGWVDQDNNNTSMLTYNFIYDNFLFLKASYDTTTSATAILGTGDHIIHAVILDDHFLPVCFEFNYTTDSGFIIGDNNTTTSITEIVMDTYSDLMESLTVDINATANGTGDSQIIADASLITTIVHEAVIENEILSQESTTSKLAQFQTSLIDIYLNTTNEYIDISKEAAGVIAVLSTITHPVVPAIANDSRFLDTASIYTDDISSKILTSMNTVLVPILAESVDMSSGTQIVQTIDNTLTIRKYSDENLNTSKKNGQLTINTAKDAAKFLTSSYIPSETVTIETETITMKASKIALDMDYNEYCSLNRSVLLSNEYVVQQSYNGTQFMDCIAMNTENNVYVVSNDAQNAYVENLIDANELNSDTTVDNVFQSNFILLEVIAENVTFTTSTSMIAETDTFLSECEPLLLHFNPTNISFFNVNLHFPQCSFYNTTSEIFDENGCYLLSYDNVHFRCSCYHASYFGVTWNDFTPEINFLSEEEWKSVTFDNVLSDPLGFIVALCWIMFCVFIIAMCQLHHRKHNLCKLCDQCDHIVDKPLIAQQDFIELATRYDNNMNNPMSKYRSVQMSRMIRDDAWINLSFCNKFCMIFRINIINDHLWLGICCRSNGSGYTNIQRIEILMVRLISSMAIAALFYARAKETSIGDLSLS